MIRTTQHSLKFTNTGKRDSSESLRTEGIRVAGIYLDWLWENSFEWDSKDGEEHYVMDIKNELYSHPSVMSNVWLEEQIGGIDTTLSCRFRKCLLTQLLGILGASLEKQRKRKWYVGELKKAGLQPSKALSKKYAQNKPVKPFLGNINLELNSICVSVETPEQAKSFDKWVTLSSLGMMKSFQIPLKMHRRANKFINEGWKLKTSILICKEGINLRWEKETPVKKMEGLTVGADQGKKDVVTFSNGDVTKKNDNHGNTLDSILLKMSKRKKGSKAFQRCSDHRENFINWSINQLNFNDFKQIKLEKIWNINFKRNTSRVLRHWTNTLIRDKIQDKGESLGIQVTEQSCTYRSQRCSVCGMVKKSHRKGKVYTCSSCGLIIDADLNAAMNHEQELPEVPYELRRLGMNRKGFLWKPDGFYSLTGTSLQSVLAHESTTSESNDIKDIIC